MRWNGRSTRRVALSDRLDALESAVTELDHLVGVAAFKVRLEYGDDIELIASLENQVMAELERLDLGGPVTFKHRRRCPEPLESLLQQLYAARGEPPRRWWTHNFRCGCGHSFTLWEMPDPGCCEYNVYCEGCLKSLGIEHEDLMCETLAREQGDEVDRWALMAARDAHSKFQRSVLHDLGIGETELPRPVNRLDPRPREDLLADIRRELEQKKAKSDKTKPISGKDLKYLREIDLERIWRHHDERAGEASRLRDEHQKRVYEAVRPPQEGGGTIEELSAKHQAEHGPVEDEAKSDHGGG